jgi:hypothetical protein
LTGGYPPATMGGKGGRRLVGGWKHFWQGLFDAKGLRPKNIVLISLSALAFIAMIFQVPPYAAIGAVVTFYCLDPILKLMKSLVARRNKLNERDVVETNFRTHLQRKRRELPSNQPELPLSLPSFDRSDDPSP